MTYIKKALTFLKKAEIPISGIWIDCGCGYGIYAEALTVLGADLVVAVDVTFSRLTRIPSPILVLNSDCRCLPVKDNSVSGFLYINVLHYYKDVHPLVEEAYRVLNRNGYVLILEYYQRTAAAWDPYPLTINDLKSVLKDCKFHIVTTGFVDTKYRPKQVVAAKKI